MSHVIVVGLDGSPREPNVLATAAQMAHAREAELVLVRAVQIPIGVPSIAWSMQNDQLPGFLLEHAHEALRQLAATLPGVPARIRCELGSPADVLCSVAESEVADLVVIGSHGYGAVDRLLGTTAAKVVNRAPCSVYVVRARESAPNA